MPRRGKKQHACLAPAGAASELPSPPPILDLPTSVLRHILAQHPLKFRLGTCSLVCSTWAATAAEATTGIVIDDCWQWEQRHYDALTAWLRKHASAALQQLVVRERCHWRQKCHSFSPPWQQLQGLRVLWLDSFVLSSGSMRQLSGLTALTQLNLSNVVCSSSSSRVVTRSQAREQLKQAKLPRQQPAAAGDTASVAATTSELARTLPRLPALVSLTLGGDIAAAVLPALTAAAAGVDVLQQLASLTLASATCITPQLSAALPATLTRLELQAVGPDLRQFDQGGWDITKSVKVSQASTPRLSQLTRLQELVLRGIGVDCSQPGHLTELFAGLTQLTAFSLNGHSSVVESNTDAIGSPKLAEFLSAMGCLTSLRSLEMNGGFRCWHWDSDDEEPWWEQDGMEPPADLAPLTAGLVASTSLTRLYLDNISLPQGCGPHMFGRPGLRLPHLAELHIEGIKDYEAIVFLPFFLDRCLTADDVSSFVSCCEGGCLRKLRKLHLKGVTLGNRFF